MRRREFLNRGLGLGLAAVAPRILEGRRSPPVLGPAPTGRPVGEAKITAVRVIDVREKAASRGEKRYLEITTDAGVSGLGGDLFQQQPRRLEELRGKLGKLLVGRDPRDRKLDSEWLWSRLYPEHDLEDYSKGRDPLTGKSIWGTRRGSRHTPTGSVVMALSAVDNALWDLRGKLAGRPVYSLLGGRRDRLPAYASVMPPDSLKEVRKRSRQLFDEGFTAQKWFLTKGPPDGEKGFRANVEQVEAVRTELGPDARLMLDFAVGQRGRCDWDVPYAISFAKAVEPFKPYWLEEPFSPEEIEAYEKLQGETEIPLATGEHTYTRWNILPFLERKLIRFVQSDPEWCGGISELLRICRLVQQYDGVRLIPHGHHVLAAAHVVASQPQDLCPMVEYGVGWIPGRQKFQTRHVTPSKGYLHLPEEPGLGPDLDWKRLERL